MSNKKFNFKSHTENPHGLHQKYIISKTDGTEIDSDGIYLTFNLRSKDAFESMAARKAAMAIVYAYKDRAMSDSTPVPTWINELHELILEIESEIK